MSQKLPATAEDIRALEISITHWEYIVEHGESDPERLRAVETGEIDNLCELCNLDNRHKDADPSLEDCESCIITWDTQEFHCHGTPYYEWRNTYGDKRDAHAKKMLKYLQDLHRRLTTPVTNTAPETEKETP